MRKPRTLRELRESGYKVLTVKEEMRKNLIEKMKKNVELFPGIIGFESTVIPQIEVSILSGHDMIFLGERGQAKTKLIRNMINLLDEEIPAVAGCEINDNPFKPICKSCKQKLDELDGDVEIDWVGREERYGEKLATPDVTTPDLIGEVDPIKVAEGRYLSDELVIHYGLIPRTNRGIFAINELPDLAEKIQVGLFNIMEERDVQIRGFKIRLPLDVYIVASANPEDYTNRGRIITPLKDRYGSQVRFHYPQTPETEIQIMEQEKKKLVDEGYKVTVPNFMKEIIAEITREARNHADISQRSGVSARMSIANYENLISVAVRRAIRLGEDEAVPRISDLPFILASTDGKIEVESIEEDGNTRVIEEIVKKGIKKVFNKRLSVSFFDPFIGLFESGTSIEVSGEMPSKDYVHLMNAVDGLKDGVTFLGNFEKPAQIASAIEFILEGLHLSKRLNKNEVEGKIFYEGDAI